MKVQPQRQSLIWATSSLRVVVVLGFKVSQMDINVNRYPPHKSYFVVVFCLVIIRGQKVGAGGKSDKLIVIT